MASQKRRKRDNMRFVYNDASSKKTAVVQLQPVRVETVKHEGTIKAQLVGKLGTRGYGTLLAELKGVTQAS